MSYPIDTTIPFEPNDPADDCPLMRINFGNINSLIKQDHIEGGAPGNGFHKEVTFYDPVTPASPPVGTTSILYTAAGVESATPDMRFVNANGTFPVNAIRACVQFTSNSGFPVNTPFTITSNFNVVQVIRTGGTNYRIDLTPNAVTGTNFMVFIHTDSTSSLGYTVAANTVAIQNITGTTIVNVMVVQI